MRISSYPSIYQAGHRATQELINHEVIIEEKVDGSAFSFALVDGQLSMRSKGCEVFEGQEGFFGKAAQTCVLLKPLMTPGWVYRGEYLSKPKHNTLAYDRHPALHIMIYDIQTGLETYLNPDEKRLESDRLGLECVPLLYQGPFTGAPDITTLVRETKSVLGGPAEGVVIKPSGYNLFGQDKKCIMAKYVAPEFKEINGATWTKEHKDKGSKDILQILGDQLNTQARWSKAVIHLQEAGKLEGSPRDIGLLINEVPKDIEKECTEEIKEALFKWAMPQLRRYTVRGLAEWYREKLIQEGLSEPASASAQEPQVDPAP
jgi:RNA ligase